MLTTPLTITGQNVLIVTFQGRTQALSGTGFTDDTSLAELSAGPDADNYLYIQLKDVKEGEFPFGPFNQITAGKSFIGYQYGDKKYASDKEGI